MSYKDTSTREELLQYIRELEDRLSESEELVDAIKSGAVDALAIHKDGKSNVFTLESVDFTYRILVEKIGESALSLTPEGLILYCNRSFMELLDAPGKSLAGHFIQEFIAPESREAFDRMFAIALAGSSKGELCLSHQTRNLSVYVSLNSLHPQVSAIGMVITDLTEKKKDEETLRSYQAELELKIKELNDSNVELEQFAHIISHDLKEPLRKITMYSDKLTRALKDSPSVDIAYYVEIMQASAKRMKALIEDLLLYSTSIDRDESGFSRFSLNEVLKKVLTDLELSIKEKNGIITTKDLPVIKGYPGQIALLFQNLLVNSLKYSRKDVRPEILIHCEIVKGRDIGLPDELYYRIAVADNGIGFDQKYAVRIFTIFQRLHGKEDYSGTGLGLAICKRIIENHKGAIAAESSEGNGATFTVYLPVVQ